MPLSVPLTRRIVIDGVNFHRTHKDLGVERVNYVQLLKALVSCTGTKLPTASRATINPELCDPRRRLYCDMKNAGILPLPAKSLGSFDDALVKKLLHESCSCSDTGEVVLVSCDHDIIEEALWLTTWHARRFNKFLKLFVVATARLCRNGSCPTSTRVIKLIEKHDSAQFVEIAGLIGKCIIR